MAVVTLPDTETMYEAFLARDSQFDGIFFTAVRSTGVFCRPTCHARKPKRENVAFYPTAKEALDHGYRPCKLCRPMEPAGDTPGWARDLLREIEEGGETRLRDQDLRDRELDPATVRRWFKKLHGMTFHAYARQLRISRAYGRIRRNEGILDSAFETGYESLSGFATAFKRTAGFSPSESKKRSVVALTRLPTPLGPMVAAVAEGAICLLEFADRPMLETQLKRTEREFKAPLIAANDPLFAAVATELEEYFRGERKEFDFPIAEFGSPFQREVWRTLRAIPYGETRSYADQATAIEKPQAVRAVARANGDNRIAIAIPCHRVIGSDGSLTGYGGGLWRKRYLLDLEQNH